MKRRILSLTIAVSMLLATLAGCGQSGDISAVVDTKKEGEAETAEAAADPLTTAAKELLNHSDTAGKEETVYIIADANGNTNKVIVSEWLKNKSGAKKLKDKTHLKDIENVKGDEDYIKGSSDSLIWNANGNDIYYQGTSTSQLPVEVSVSYQLNGKPVQVKELEGASGKLTMEFSYRNNTGKKVKIDGENAIIYQPFLMVSGLLLDNEKAANVEVEHGRVINSGDQTAVVGLAMPGLEESLGLSDLKDGDGKAIDLDIPDKVTITADVTNFSLLATVTVAENTALRELSLDDVDSVDDLKDSLEKLEDASKELVDGTKALFEGVGKLNDKSGDLAKGVAELDKGAKKLDDGAQQLDQGAKDLNEGASQLDKGTNELASKVESLPSAAEQLLNGAQTLRAALGNAESKNETIYTGAMMIEAGAQELAANLKNNDQSSVYEVAVGIQGGAAKLEAGAQMIASKLNEAAGSLNTSIGSLNQAVEQLSALAQSDSEHAESYVAVIKEIKTSVAYQQGVQDALTSTKQNTLQAGLAEIAAGAQAIQTYAEKISIGSEKLQAGANQLGEGARKIEQGIDTMVSGNHGQNLNTMIAGLTELNAQSGELVKGTQELAEGAGKLSDGTGKLAGSTGILSDGTSTLAEGTCKLSAGTDLLISGIGKLLDGSEELAEGMAQFDKEGIQKLTELMDADLDKVVDRLKAVQDYAEEYHSFGGCPANLECTTKFIYKTDSVGE